MKDIIPYNKLTKFRLSGILEHVCCYYNTINRGC